MAQVGYRTIIDNLKTAISGGTGLNTNLSRVVMQVVDGDPFIVPIPNTMYPTIMVDLMGMEEEWSDLGNSRKNITLTLNIYCLIFYQGTSADSDKEAHHLADNVEQIIRADVTLSGTVDWMSPASTDFATGFKDGVHLSCAVIELKIFKLIS